MHINKRNIGKIYEDKAVCFLKDNGYNILCRNYNTLYGEIDIIARKDNYINFVEVKYRSSESYGRPAEAVDKRKQSRIIKAAEIFLSRNEDRLIAIYGAYPYISFDIIEIYRDNITFIEGAFAKC